MRTKLIAWAITFITAVTLSVGQELGSDASILKDNYKKGIESIRQDQGKKVEERRRWYIVSVEELLTRVKKTGDLDKTTAVMAEIERFRKNNAMPDNAAEMPDIRKLQVTYSKQLAQLEGDTANRIVVLTGQYDKDLESLEKRLVASDKIDQAKSVRSERNEVQQSEVVILARNALTKPGKQLSIFTDRAVGGNPTPVYLDDLEEIDVKIGYGKLGKHGEDGAGANRKFSVRGITLTHALYTHPPSDGSSSVSYRLGETYSTFRGIVTVTDDSNPRVPLIFRVIGDNDILWQSQPVRKAGETQEFAVSIKKIKKITLDVTCPGVNHQSGAVWQDPRLSSVPIESIKKPVLPNLSQATVFSKRPVVRILSAIYGSGGKNADVTEKVKDYVEVKRQAFTASPGGLGADPNPYWNKSLTIKYIKDGVHREQRRNENESVLIESFYGPQDDHELEKLLAGTRWKSDVELDFRGDNSFVVSGQFGFHRWQVKDSNNKMLLIWDQQKKNECVFDSTWSTFQEKAEGNRIFKRVE